MKYFFSFGCLFLASGYIGDLAEASSEYDAYKLKAELDLLKLILRGDTGDSSASQKLGDPIEQTGVEPVVRTLPYMVDKRKILEELEDDIEDDEELTEVEKDQLFDSLDTIMTRARGNTCNTKRYTCPNTDPVVCLRYRDMCNGVSDCSDGSDESEATCNTYFDAFCPIRGRFHCIRNDRHICLARDRMCEGREQCEDGSDEVESNCRQMPPCDDEKYIRRDGTHLYETCTGSLECLRTQKWCDERDHCENGADETDCEDDLMRRELLHAHNVLRDVHEDTPPMTWDQEVADRAQAWADYLARNDLFEHSASGSEYRQNSGENIYLSSSPRARLTNAIISFYSEEWEAAYNYATGTGNGGVIGHFTQLVWDNSIRLGCGVNRDDGSGTYVVCQYSPPGNYRGAYANHVHPPKPGMDPQTVANALRESTG